MNLDYTDCKGFLSQFENEFTKFKEVLVFSVFERWYLFVQNQQH